MFTPASFCRLRSQCPNPASIEAGVRVKSALAERRHGVKKKAYTLSEDERRAATRAALAGLESGELNEPPERKRAICGIFEARDARFDGRVYVGVSSTGVYCRPVCPYHAKLENVTFYASAAAAEAAGYRPCLVYRPEMAPGTSLADSRGSLARRAACMSARGCTVGVDIEGLSARLGYTSRHVRRVFLDEYGVTPAAFLRTCRCSLAKSLLADTALPMSQVAFASGFKSARRFNDVFKSHYGLVPSEQRRLARACCGRAAERRGAIRLRLGYRPPFRFEELLASYRRRAVAGVLVSRRGLAGRRGCACAVALRCGCGFVPGRYRRGCVFC